MFDLESKNFVIWILQFYYIWVGETILFSSVEMTAIPVTIFHLYVFIKGLQIMRKRSLGYYSLSRDGFICYVFYCQEEK